MGSHPGSIVADKALSPSNGFRPAVLSALANRVEAGIVARVATESSIVSLDTGRDSAWADRVRSRVHALPQGGSVVFNALSRPYLDVTATKKRTAAAASVPELVAFANGHGLRITAVVGYGFLLGHPFGGTTLLAPTDATYRWRRMLSWLRRDDALEDLAARIDLEVVSRLPLWCSPSVMVAMERGGGPHAVPDAESTTVVDPLRLPGRIVQELDALLEPVKARLFGFALLDHLAVRWPEFGAERLLTARRAEQYQEWVRANQLNRDVTRVVRHWADGSDDRMRHATDLTLCCDYVVVRRVFEDYFALFRGVST